MEKRLYLNDYNLGFVRKAKEQTGEQLGGDHVARIQTGIEKDGSPQYRYFKTWKEYDEFLKKKSDEKKKKPSSKISSGTTGNKKRKQKLVEKLEKEQKQSSKYARSNPSNKVGAQHSKNRSVFANNTASVKKFSVKKSVRLYLGEK